MFDIDEFIGDCRDALAEAQPRLAIKDLLERAVSDPAAVEAALPATRSELVPLHQSPELTVLKVVWAPGMRFVPHDHAMWASIGIYGGAEDNEFFRRSGDGIVPSGGTALRLGDACLLGDDTIHAVTNPSTRFTGAIHIYGGDLFAAARREWRGDPPVEGPYDSAATMAYFEAANEGPAGA